MYFLYYHLLVILLDSGAAWDKENLTRMSFTHVLNAAQRRTQGHPLLDAPTEEREPSMVYINAEYYQDIGIEYLGFTLADSPDVNISQYLEEAADFIDNALLSGGEWT